MATTKTGVTAKTVRVPISNIPANGDYTAQIQVGSQKAPANVIMDTGSSTLAVKNSVYKPASDTNLKPTTLAQDVTYGTGGWAGPVVTTSVSMGVPGNDITLQSSPMAIADDQQPHNFGAADGILGLAYNALNNGFNLAPYLQKHNINPAATYPWPFATTNSSALLAQLGQLFNTMPPVLIPPYFDEVEKSGITANKFAFYTLRSVPSMAGANHAQNKLNQGFFILGGGQEQAGLFTGAFQNVDVVDDAWYNTDLKAVQVGNAAPVNITPLTADQKRQFLSNSIIDSGTNALFLSPDVLNAVLAGLQALNAEFLQAVTTAMKQRGGIAAAGLDLSKWPGITFILTGDAGQDVKLTCSPQTYWQVDAPRAGHAMCQLINGGSAQSILGLPLMNNYYTVFDRSLERTGVIRFAPINANPSN